jgi:ribosomal protein L29
MKKKDLAELRLKEIKEIENLLSKKKLELMVLISKLTAGGEKNLKKGRNLKKEIAQILTIIKEKKLIETMKVEKEK